MRTLPKAPERLYCEIGMLAFWLLNFRKHAPQIFPTNMQPMNRQQNHEWGPWMWTATGSYAEPLQSDEQPESWHAFTPE